MTNSTDIILNERPKLMHPLLKIWGDGQYGPAN